MTQVIQSEMLVQLPFLSAAIRLKALYCLTVQVSIRVCDVNQGKMGEAAIALVLPTLLHKGVANSAEEVRAIRYEVRHRIFQILSVSCELFATLPA